MRFARQVEIGSEFSYLSDPIKVDSSTERDQVTEMTEARPEVKIGITSVPWTRYYEPSVGVLDSNGKTPLVGSHELYIENAGPGIATKLSAMLISVDVSLLLGETNTKWWRMGPEEILSGPHFLHEFRLSLASNTLPAGPQNRMSVLNLDKSALDSFIHGGADWDMTEFGVDMRIQVVVVSWADSEGNRPREISAGANWVPLTDRERAGEMASQWQSLPNELVEKVVAEWRGTPKSA